MFSHRINSPKHFIIKKDYHVIPFGHRCTSALACKYATIRMVSLPFDWCNPLYPKKIQRVIENNFEDFIPDVHNGIFTNKYEFTLTHFDADIANGVEQYKRRIDRFKQMMKESRTKYFVYINEDYLYDSGHREDAFNDKIFNEMLELEIFLKNHYPYMKYKVLYFNFKEHAIPADSNIINIVLSTTSPLYDTHDDAPYEELRKYCGKVLAELFNTSVLVGYDFQTFND